MSTHHTLESSGVSDEEIRMMIDEEVAPAIRAEILEMFGSIKIPFVETFDERYTNLTDANVVAAVAAARP